MRLDLNAVDPAVEREMTEVSAKARVALCAAISERLLPLYKGFVDGADWQSVERCLEEAWKFVAGKKTILKRVLWDRSGQLTSFHDREGKPLLLYGVVTRDGLAAKHQALGGGLRRRLRCPYHASGIAVLGIDRGRAAGRRSGGRHPRGPEQIDGAAQRVVAFSFTTPSLCAA
ncbi:MAG: hypothetical protein J0L92_06855 [Deltaproteobacteria bacterium]|nr:hypothetical protein [Deltaproteobacteria bacterium]